MKQTALQKSLKPIKISSKMKGPVVWLVSGQHGDEPNGPEIVKGVLAVLRHKLKQGSIYALPETNYIGLKTNQRKVNGLDLNRCYPGKKSGKPAEKMAYKIFSALKKTKPDLVLDIHNDWPGSLFYAVLDPRNLSSQKIYEKITTTAGQTKIATIKEKNDSKNIKEMNKTLSGCCLKNNIPALTLELGDCHKLNRQNIKNGVKVILNLLAKLKMIDLKQQKLEPPLPPRLLNMILKEQNKPCPSKPGLIKFKVKPGQIIKPKTIIATITNPAGEIVETLRTKKTTFVLSLIDKKIVKKKESVVALGELE